MGKVDLFRVVLDLEEEGAVDEAFGGGCDVEVGSSDASDEGDFFDEGVD